MIVKRNCLICGREVESYKRRIGHAMNKHIREMHPGEIYTIKTLKFARTQYLKEAKAIRKEVAERYGYAL